MTAIVAPRVRALDLALIDDIAGHELVFASLNSEAVSLNFRHVQGQTQRTVSVPAASDWRGVIATGKIEPVDASGRSRLLQVSPSGSEALRGVVRGIDEHQRSARAARSVKADVTLFGITKSSSRALGTVIAIQAAPVNAELKYENVIYLEAVKLTVDRLEITVRIGEQTLLAALENPSNEMLEAFSWGASASRLTWYGLLEGMQRPEPIKVVTESIEQIHQALKGSRNTARNSVPDR